MIRDYSGKTMDEWFTLRRWKAFLLTIPAGKTIIRECESYRDVQAIRVTASALNSNPDCGVRFSVKTEAYNERCVVVEAKRK